MSAERCVSPVRHMVSIYILTFDVEIIVEQLKRWKPCMTF